MIAITGVTKDKDALVIAGSGNITAKGNARELEATINGSGNAIVRAIVERNRTLTRHPVGSAHGFLNHM
ncbi:MAG: hypothetical protein KKG09_05505 [Verrucomicrobia bacterium]|nr:hypothetical protein [Verrucomicrobiota bacterium]MCG2681641.1 hypothetical protein [Kiritimatiellia bacterium]MBU4248093.1 hypothetical protein [Verrucomicrobiota bacterium]MBU4290769.1 hypothetical protein [Verrucomicrobiota bacterium]MBU4429756.1 hypothetical protein [Verrucomicrobiota bacterium]